MTIYSNSLKDFSNPQIRKNMTQFYFELKQKGLLCKSKIDGLVDFKSLGRHPSRSGVAPLNIKN